MVGHDGESLGGMVASLMTFPEHGIVVAVISNTSYADTFVARVENRAGLRCTEAKSRKQITLRLSGPGEP